MDVIQQEVTAEGRTVAGYVLVNTERDAAGLGSVVAEAATIRADGTPLIRHCGGPFGQATFATVADAKAFAARLGVDNVEPRPWGVR